MSMETVDVKVVLHQNKHVLIASLHECFEVPSHKFTSFFLKGATYFVFALRFSYCGLKGSIPSVHIVSGILCLEDVPGKVLGFLPSRRLLSQTV